MSRMYTRLSLEGQILGRLTVVCRADDREVGKDRKKRAFWKCICTCGEEVEVILGALRSGGTKSCGCLQRDAVAKSATKHGKVDTVEYRSWQNMIQRCTNSKRKDYKYYGGRGIKVCARWLASFVKFFTDMGECPKGMTLDRRNNSGNYEPGNCKWSTPKEQAANRREPKRRRQ